MTRRFSSISIAIITAIACSSSGSDRSADFLGAAKAGLREVERGTPGVVIAVNAADRQMASVLCRLRHCVDRTRVPASESFLLPRGYFILSEFKVAGNEGTLAGTLGPIDRPQPGRETLGCGYGVRVALHRQPSGLWVAGDVEVTVC